MSSQGQEEAETIADWLMITATNGTYTKYEDYNFDEWTKIVDLITYLSVFLVKERTSPHYEQKRKTCILLWVLHQDNELIPVLVYGVHDCRVFLTKSSTVLKRAGTKADPRSMPLPGL